MLVWRYEVYLLEEKRFPEIAAFNREIFFHEKINFISSRHRVTSSIYLFVNPWYPIANLQSFSRHLKNVFFKKIFTVNFLFFYWQCLHCLHVRSSPALSITFRVEQKQTRSLTLFSYIWFTKLAAGWNRAGALAIGHRVPSRSGNMT